MLKEKRNSLIIYDFSLETYKHEGIYRVRTVTDNNIKSKAAQNTRNNTIDQSPVLVLINNTLVRNRSGHLVNFTIDPVEPSNLAC